MPKHYYELTDDKSSKFWEIEQKGSAVHLRWGKIGTQGQSKIKELDSKEDATKEVDKLIRQKTKKGYLAGKPAMAKTGASRKTVQAKVRKKAAPKKKPAAAVNPATAAKPALLKYVKDSSRTPAELKKSIGRYVEVDRAIAARDEVPPGLLSQLSHSSDKATRSKVIANPNILPEDFLRLGPQFSKAFLANPVLSLILLEDPAILSEFDAKLLVQIAKNPECPQGFLRWAADRQEEQVQLAVAMNAKAPEDALKALKGSDHKSVRESLSFKAAESTSPESLEQEFVEAVKERIKAIPTKGVYGRYYRSSKEKPLQ